MDLPYSAFRFTKLARSPQHAAAAGYKKAEEARRRPAGSE